MNKEVLAYIIGLALGDGNLSNPNGRAVRLRITCDTEYPKIINRICLALQTIMPTNKIGLIKGPKPSSLNISCYSNQWEKLLGWNAKTGSKYKQNVSVPSWIKDNTKFTIACLKGLIETDGSIYLDRNYKMVNFVNTVPGLANDVADMMKKLGFFPRQYIYLRKKTKYTIRLSKQVDKFIALTGITKE